MQEYCQREREREREQGAPCPYAPYSRLCNELFISYLPIATEVAHVTRDWDTTFRVKRSKVKVTWSISP